MPVLLPISLVIPTMNRPKSFHRTMECLLGKQFIPSQIIVVDQSQIDTDRMSIQKCIDNYKNLLDVKYIYQNYSSLTKARNTGFEYCKFDIIIYMDDDVDVFDNTVYNVYKLMQNPNISMVAGVDENAGFSHSRLSYFFFKKSYKNRFIGHITPSMLGRYPDIIIGDVETMWAMGYFFAIKKALKSQWGIYWDERLLGSAYPEDLDFSYSYYKKSRENNFKCILSDKVKVKHLLTQEYRENTFKNTCMYIINREYLSYKHKRGKLALLANRWTNFGEFLFRLIHNSKPLDVIKAQFYCDLYRKDIKNGILHYELYF